MEGVLTSQNGNVNNNNNSFSSSSINFKPIQPIQQSENTVQELLERVKQLEDDKLFVDKRLYNMGELLLYQSFLIKNLQNIVERNQNSQSTFEQPPQDEIDNAFGINSNVNGITINNSTSVNTINRSDNVTDTNSDINNNIDNNNEGIVINNSNNTVFHHQLFEVSAGVNNINIGNNDVGNNINGYEPGKYHEVQLDLLFGENNSEQQHQQHSVPIDLTTKVNEPPIQETSSSTSPFGTTLSPFSNTTTTITTTTTTTTGSNNKKRKMGSFNDKSNDNNKNDNNIKIVKKREKQSERLKWSKEEEHAFFENYKNYERSWVDYQKNVFPTRSESSVRGKGQSLFKKNKKTGKPIHKLNTDELDESTDESNDEPTDESSDEN